MPIPIDSTTIDNQDSGPGSSPEQALCRNDGGGKVPLVQA